MDEQSANELVQGVIKKINYAEYKRKQAAIALKISRRDFSIGRRFPIVQKYEE
jgi:NAD+ synthase (glutamine-hydrolysing)